MPPDQPVIREVAIRNTHGLHARPVMKFVDLAQTFTADIVVQTTKNSATRVDGKSAMEMMLLGANCGTILRITAAGADAAKAADALVELVNNRFGTET